MPFSIDYDGPAPIDSFLVLSPASEPGAPESFTSAFRGRAIQSTSLPLPSGYKAKLVAVEQIAPSPTAQPSSSTNGANGVEGGEREKKRQRVAKPPARQQKFSMDSDEEGSEPEEEEHEEQSPAPQSEPVVVEAGITPAEVKEKMKLRITPIAQVKGDELRVWGPDGPIDRGDDTFFRTVGEWFGVVAPLVSPASARLWFVNVLFAEN